VQAAIFRLAPVPYARSRLLFPLGDPLVVGIEHVNPSWRWLSAEMRGYTKSAARTRNKVRRRARFSFYRYVPSRNKAKALPLCPAISIRRLVTRWQGDGVTGSGCATRPPSKATTSLLHRRIIEMGFCERRSTRRGSDGQMTHSRQRRRDNHEQGDN
jgi:hypothetical protein